MLQPCRTIEPPDRAKVQKALFDAIRKGDLKAIARSLDQGADLNAREIVPTKPSRAKRNGPDTEEQDTPLTLALGWDAPRIEDEKQRETVREQMVRFLLDKRADVNRPGEYGYTPLMLAAQRCRPRIIELLLQRGAKLEQENVNGTTALTFAINRENTDSVNLLLRNGASINGPAGSSANTPLMEAVTFGSPEMVKLLLQKGADPNIRRGGRTALELALIGSNGFQDKETITLLRRVGARGRSLDELKSGVEREKREFDEKLRRDEAERRQQADRYRKEREVTAEDARVIQAALLDILGVRVQSVLFSDKRKRSEVVLFDATPSQPGMVNDEQINGELSVELARAITIEMRDNLWQRNLMSSSLVGTRFHDRRIRVERQPEKQSYDPFWFEKKYPNARLRVDVYLPGYNRAHDRAVLRFWVGPSYHETVCTSFLTRNGNRWQVAWRQISYLA